MGMLVFDTYAIFEVTDYTNSMQRRRNGVNPVGEKDWDEHIAEEKAKLLRKVTTLMITPRPTREGPSGGIDSRIPEIFEGTPG